MQSNFLYKREGFWVTLPMGTTMIYSMCQTITQYSAIPAVVVLTGSRVFFYVRD